MTTSKYVGILCLLMICPVCQMYGQEPARTKRVVVLPTGDTIYTTNYRTRVLTAEDVSFFKRDTTDISALMDELYLIDSKRYKSLEAAASNVSNLLDTLSEEKEKDKSNSSLSFRLSQKNRKRINKENEAAEEWEKQQEQEQLSVNDMVALYEKFGDKPTYYINGVEVPENTVNHLRPVDILNRQFKVTNTASNNPNGEIWLEVPIPLAQSLLSGSASHAKEQDGTNKPDSKQKAKPAQTGGKEKDGAHHPVEEKHRGNSIINRRKEANRPDLIEEEPVKDKDDKKARKETKKQSGQSKGSTATFNLKRR